MADNIIQHGCQRKLQILCLHGSRQDGEVFSQRLRTLQKKLKSIADLHFVSAPHTLPLQDGQAVPMRAWWRHWHVSPSDEPQQISIEPQQQQQQQQSQVHVQAQVPNKQHGSQQEQHAAELPQQPLQQQASLHGKERELEVQAMMAAGWEAVVLRDWAVSLQHLCETWQAGPPRMMAGPAGGNAAAAGSSSTSSLSSLASSASSSSRNNAAAGAAAGVMDANTISSSSSSSQAANGGSCLASGTAAAAAMASASAVAQSADRLEYDGVLGFSNGAAAAFLFVAHAAAHLEWFRSLQFVALAGGYVPEPLEKLLPQQLLKHPAAMAAAAAGTGDSSNSSGGGDVPPVDRLACKLPFASLHMMGSNDPLMDVADSSQLMHCFQEHGRVQLIHDSGHSVPQQSRYMQEILKFIVNFAEIQLPLGHHKHRHKPPSTAAVAAPAELAVPAVLLQKAPSLQKAGRGPLHRLPSVKVTEVVAAAGAAAAAAAPVEAVAAEIESKLHRQGLRDKATKGPHKQHPLIRLDATGQPHQHVDLLSPKTHASRRQQQQHHHHHTKQQQQQQPGSKSGAATSEANEAAAAAAAAAAAEVEAAPEPSSGADAAAADAEFGEASDVQLEELEALEAIFGSEYHLVSSCPPCCAIKLREPDPLGDCDGGDEQQGNEQQQGPPSRLFTLKFKLPKAYPASDAAPPVIEIEGPLGKHDPARAALQAHLAAAAVQQQQEMGGAGGYVWQLAGAAKEWIDANLPADIDSRRAGEVAGTSAAAAATTAAAGVQGSMPGIEGLGLTGQSAANGVVSGSGSSSSSSAPWWEKEEVDLGLIDRATAEAAAAHWRSWAVADGSSPFGTPGGEEEGQEQEHGSAAAAGSAGAAGASAASAGGEGSLGFGGLESTRGRWDYTVGLVGKPSAGKSTFYNAVIDPSREEDAAREAPFPFTTIQPNVGRGHIVLPDPALLLGLTADTAQPAHGYALGFDPCKISAAFSNIGPLWQLVKDCGWAQQQQGASGSSSSILWRRVPVVAKDVAGLVPGAYKGRGRGNAFLNDLCDADVLVHVVDASGTTDSEGAGAAPGEGADPRQEVLWVRRELHCWVYDNVRAKWPGVLRRPTRLPGLFSGYHAPSGLVAAVLRAVGVRLEDLTAEEAAAGNAGLQGGTKESAAAAASSSLASWGEWELHRLVAHFLAARFPILLALNKADLPSAQAHIHAVLAAYPHDAALAVSAASERKLQQLRRAGHVSYLDAAAIATTQADGSCSSCEAAAAAAAAVQDITQNVLQPYGSTGVLAALTCAVALKPPRWCFPIADRESCTALAAVSSRAAAGGGGGVSHGNHHHSGSSKGHSGCSAAALGWGADAKARAAQGAATGVLRDCILLKPGSRVEDVYQVLKRPPYGLLEGEFVRAECRVLTAGEHGSRSNKQAVGVGAADPDHEQQQQRYGSQGGPAAAAAVRRVPVQCRVVRKDELLGPSNCVLLLQTNRKVSWQLGAAARRHH